MSRQFPQTLVATLPLVANTAHGRAGTRLAIDDIKHMKGQTIETLSPEQHALWTKRIEPVIASWEKSTPDGAHVLAAFRQEVAAIRSGS